MNTFPVRLPDLRRSILLLASLLVAMGLAACGGTEVVHPAEDDELEVAEQHEELSPQVVLTWDRARCRHPCGTQGVFGKVILKAAVVDQNGNPWPDQMVHWQVGEGGGTLSWYAAGGDDWPPPSEGAGTEVIRSASLATAFRLGGVVGTQTVEAWVEGSDTTVLEIEAVPGAVFVAAVTELAGAFDHRPSDTLRIHVADIDNMARAVSSLEELESVRVSGSVVPGAGLDPAWAFHLEPSSVQAFHPTGSIVGCVQLPWDEATLQAVLDDVSSQYRHVCPYQLELVRIEDVPAAYLDAIR